ncbi:PPC domain-containing protein [Leptothermofonsia sp. ETS-13]|uniref:PPC domain-containing protein n=1 Tax=Leptothermofonsia sp. ETS-13 TaxID=3035696 RepID=UPI003B9E5A15
MAGTPRKDGHILIHRLLACLTSTGLILVQALPIAASSIDQDAASLIKKEQPAEPASPPPPRQQDPPPTPPPPPAASGASDGSAIPASTQPSTPSTPATSAELGGGSSSSQPPSSAAPTSRPASRKATVKRLNFVDVEFGVLAKGDPVASDRYYHTYYFEGKKDQAIAIRLVGSRDPRLNLNPAMFLYGPDGQEPIARRFGGESTEKSAFLQIRLPEDGTYSIVVTSREPRKEGRYSLALRDDRISYLLDKTGDLTDESPKLKQDGSSFQSYEFQGKRGQYVNIRADSLRAEFSPSVYLLNSKREIIATSSDMNYIYSALIERTQLPEDDTYYIVVNSMNPTGRGRFRVSVY